MSEKTQALLQQLQTEVISLTTEEKWKDYLTLQTLFHDYSFRNILLIHTQNPGATAVAGFHTWRKMGRFVKKGEKGIAILAPMMFGKRQGARESGGKQVGKGRAACTTADARASQGAATGDSSSVDEGQKRLGFRPVHVFDVSQTEGEPLPEPPTSLLTGHEDQATAAFHLLENFAQAELEIPVEDAELPPSTHGYFDRKQRKIAIREGNPALHRAKTLAHEIGHAILHAEASDSHERPVMEVEAESVAFIVMNHLGLDSGEYSFGYVALWGQEKHAAKIIQECGTRIAQAANRVISFLQAQRTEEHDDSDERSSLSADVPLAA